MHTDLRHSMLWCTAYCSEGAGDAGLRSAERHLAAFIDGRMDAELVAACDPHGSGSTGALASGLASDDGGSGEEDDDVLDGYLLPPRMRRHCQPLVCCVVMPALPRG